MAAADTTTSRQLAPIGDGAVLIDMPGLRTVGLADANDGMSQVFGDVEDLFAYCRFRDCSHGSEPGCAIRAAIDEGALDARRWTNYLKLEREQERIQRRKESVVRRADRKEVARNRIKSARRSREP